MKNTKTKEPRYYEISVVRDTITRVVEVDDSISNEELEDYELQMQSFNRKKGVTEEEYRKHTSIK